MTETEAYEKLGLIDPDHYESFGVLDIFNTLHGSNRETGKTTRLLVNAAIALCEGYVVQIKGCSNSYTMKLQRDCCAMARILNPEIGPVFEREPGGFGIGTGNSTNPVKVFIDHYRINI